MSATGSGKGSGKSTGKGITTELEKKLAYQRMRNGEEDVFDKEISNYAYQRLATSESAAEVAGSVITSDSHASVCVNEPKHRPLQNCCLGFCAILSVGILVVAVIFIIPFILKPNYGTDAYPRPPFDVNIANRSVYLCQAAYCDTAGYSTYVHRGAAAGFVYSGQVHDPDTDMTGYWGSFPSSKQIWMVYRGTDSFLNDLDDADFFPESSDYSGCPSCLVHAGMRDCNDNTIQAGPVPSDYFVFTVGRYIYFCTSLLSDGIRGLTAAHPDYRLFVTGHSLGAATATLAAVSLTLQGFNATLYAIASPRVGNQAFSDYVAQLFPYERQPFRLSHSRDVVVHVPEYHIGYVHIATEVYEDEQGQLHACYGPEDAGCAAQWRTLELNIDDHMNYLGHPLSCAL